MAAINPFAAFPETPQFPAIDVVPIVPNDGADLSYVVRMIFVGTGGNVEVVTAKGTTTIHKNVAAGSYLGPFCVARVKAGNTTASDLLGYI